MRMTTCAVPQESWYEKLNRWDEALEAYERKYHDAPIGTPAHLDAALGRLRSDIPLLHAAVVTIGTHTMTIISPVLPSCLSGEASVSALPGLHWSTMNSRW